MASSNTYSADSTSADRYSGQRYSTLPEALYSLSCLTDLYEIGNVLGGGIELQDLRQHILAHLSHAIRARGASLLLYHTVQQRLIPVASLGERLPTAKLIAAIDWRVMGQQALHGPGETLATLPLDNQPIVLVTLSYNETLLGMVALSITDKNILADERSLLLAFMGKVAALHLHNYELTNQLRQEAINQERNRIARELHDGITQQITHTLHKLEYIQHSLGTNCPLFVLSELQHVQNTLNDSLHDLRNMMGVLLSAQAEKVTLTKTIRQVINEYKSNHPQTELELKITGIDESQHLPPKLEILVLQCIQEALTNAWKHAQATSIQIHLYRSAGWLIIEVSDNGIGFQTEQVPIASEDHHRDEQHFGLVIMHERIKEAGGNWELQSQPGKGTTVRARFPPAISNNELTKREYEILHLVSDGLTNREIARRLEISIDTVKMHMHRIMQKLGVKDRVQAVAVGYRNGWL